MSKAATGSAHHQPAHAFSVRPMIGPPKRRWQRMRGKQEPSLELGRDPGRYSARNRQPDPDVLPQCHEFIAKWLLIAVRPLSETFSLAASFCSHHFHFRVTLQSGSRRPWSACFFAASTIFGLRKARKREPSSRRRRLLRRVRVWIQGSDVPNKMPDLLVRIETAEPRHSRKTDAVLHHPKQFRVGISLHFRRAEAGRRGVEREADLRGSASVFSMTHHAGDVAGTASVGRQVVAPPTRGSAALSVHSSIDVPCKHALSFSFCLTRADLIQTQ